MADPTTPAVFSFSRQPVASAPPAVVPEVPLPLVLPLTALAAAGLVVAVRRRRAPVL